ncbi:MAG: phosphatase PAP2-related protein [Myxococcota bacterium]
MKFTPRILSRVVGSLVFRLGCYYVMVWLALWAEARPVSGRLPDLVLDAVPYVPLVDRYNYLLWLVSYVPVALWLLWRDVDRFVRYMVSSGLIALVRGVSIVVTGLGPVRGDDLHAGMDFDTRLGAFLHLITPFGFFDTGAGARVYLTKDLFFSGHTATTLLLLLYVWRYPALRAVMLVTHVAVVASVFLAHLHYTIDVIGAYAVTLTLFTLREGRLGVTAEAAPSSVPRGP